MPTSRAYGHWTQPSYEVKVRGTMHLWGSASITKDMVFDKPVLLHIHNDLFGEDITLETRKASGAPEPIGTLKAGECFSIPLNGISGVVASCAKESIVCCLIK